MTEASFLMARAMSLPVSRRVSRNPPMLFENGKLDAHQRRRARVVGYRDLCPKSNCRSFPFPALRVRRTRRAKGIDGQNSPPHPGPIPSALPVNSPLQA